MHKNIYQARATLYYQLTVYVTNFFIIIALKKSIYYIKKDLVQGWKFNLITQVSYIKLTKVIKQVS